MSFNFCNKFKLIFNKYKKLGYDDYTARYLTYRDLR